LLVESLHCLTGIEYHIEYNGQLKQADPSPPGSVLYIVQHQENEKGNKSENVKMDGEDPMVCIIKLLPSYI
jgi:hypothetical protein